MLAKEGFVDTQATSFVTSHEGSIVPKANGLDLADCHAHAETVPNEAFSSTSSVFSPTNGSTPSSSSELSADPEVKLEDTATEEPASTAITTTTTSTTTTTTTTTIQSAEPSVVRETQEETAKVLKQEPEEPPKKKPKKKASQLDKLLECADWYVTSLAGSGSRVRQSALKYENIKEEIRENIQIEAEPKEEKTAEELEAIAARKRELAEKRKIKQQEKELEKQKKRAEYEQRKKLRDEMIRDGLIQEKEHNASSSLVELLEGASYFASVVTKHNNSEEVEIGQSEREGLFLRKTLKKVERYAPEFEHKDKKKWPKMKKMFQSKIPSSEKEKKKKAPKAKKPAKPKGESKPRGGKKRSNSPEQEVKQEAEAEAEAEEEEEEEEVEEEEKWFLNLSVSEDMPLLEGQKFFREEVYQDKEIEISHDIGLVTPESMVKENLGSYQLDHPNFKPTQIEIVFPLSNYKERYYLCLPSKFDVYNPFDDIGRTMELIALTYLPQEHQAKVFNFESPMDCIIGRYIQAFTDENYDKLIESINEFNQLITSLKDDPLKPINKFCAAREEFPSVAVYELLNQCYSRTVLPNSRQLKSYKAFSNYVYGELMPSFLTLLYKQCKLNPSSKFIDLGSGVGNCSIQSALQFGCESYGVEIMEHASNLADLQLIDFENRCKAYGFHTGPVKLFGRQSFIDNPEVKDAVDKCDVILCNNYLFDAALNKKVNDQLFNNLQTGTKIISLKPIVPPGHTISWDNIDSILNRIKTTRFTYGNNSVSWTSNGGYYYVSEVMNDIVDENFVVFQSRSKRGTYTIDESSRERTPLNAFTHNV